MAASGGAFLTKAKSQLSLKACEKQFLGLSPLPAMLSPRLFSEGPQIGLRNFRRATYPRDVRQRRFSLQAKMRLSEAVRTRYEGVQGLAAEVGSHSLIH